MSMGESDEPRSVGSLSPPNYPSDLPCHLVNVFGQTGPDEAPFPWKNVGAIGLTAETIPMAPLLNS
jgi:hypothetical protein